MKKILLIFFIIILFMVFFAWNNTHPGVIISRLIKKGDIRTGELRYKVYLLGILPIGEAIFGVENIGEYKGLNVYHLNATGKTLRLYSKIFKGYAIFDSYVDTKNLNPILFKQRIEAPGNENPYKEVIYDQKNGTVTIEGVMRQIFPNTQDPLSAIFNLKHMDFNNVKEIQMNINTNQKNYVLDATVGPKDILIGKKIYRIAFLKAEIRRRDKNPYHKSSITMVLLREKENIPILIKVFASGFLINAKLVDIK